MFAFHQLEQTLVHVRIIAKDTYLLTIVEVNRKPFQERLVRHGHLKYLTSRINPYS